jgi:DNA (cytosine-5)-methyltransferase 1
MKLLGIQRGELDLFDFSPPCKAFSSAGVQADGWNKEVLYSDGIYQRVDDLFDHGIRMLRGFKPKAFIGENVSGLVKGISQGYFTEIFKQLEDAGYIVRAFRIDPILLGVPQSRERLIYMGVREDIDLTPVPPKPVAANKRSSIRSVLPHIQKFKANATKDMVGYFNANVPSPTIVASDFDTSETARFSCGGWCEDDEGRRRKYTLLELRRLMTFPDDFKLTGTPRQQWERLGRSHAPLQVYHLANALRTSVLEPYYKENKVKFGNFLI